MTAFPGLAPLFNIQGTIVDPATGEPLLGTVTFTPTVKALLVGQAPKPFTALPQPTVATLDRNGDLTYKGSTTIPLVATDDPGTNPTGNWNYTVSFSLKTLNGKAVKYDAFSIVAPSGQTANLTQVSQVTPGNGTPTTVGPATVISIGTVTTTAPGTPATASMSGTAPAQTLSLTIPNGEQGLQGNPGDMVPVVGPADISGTVTLQNSDLPSTRLRRLVGNVTFVLPTPSASLSGTISLVLTQDGTGGRTITWPVGVLWPDGIPQQPATAAGSKSVFHLLWTGAEWLGMLGGKSFA